MDRRGDGARPTGTRLGGERRGGTPLRDVAFDAIETDIIAVGDDGLGSAAFDGLDDALAEVLGICFHGLIIASSLYLCKSL